MRELFSLHKSRIRGQSGARLFCDLATLLSYPFPGCLSQFIALALKKQTSQFQPAFPTVMPTLNGSDQATMLSRMVSSTASIHTMLTSPRDCAGDNALFCIHVILAKGTASMDTTAVQQVGSIGCVSNQPISLTTLVTTMAPTAPENSPTTKAGVGGTSEPTTGQTAEPTTGQTDEPTSRAGSKKTVAISSIDHVTNLRPTDAVTGLGPQPTNTDTSLPSMTGATSTSQPEAMTCGSSLQTVTKVTTVPACQPPVHS